MSDETQEVTDSAEASTDSTPSVETTESEVVEASSEEAAVAEKETEQESFDRAYVEKLRDENARYRTERNELRELFGEGDEAEWWKQAMQAAKGDPKQAAEIFNTVAQQFANEAGEVQAEDERFLTYAEYKALEAARQQETVINEIRREAIELGYSGDPNDARYNAFLAIVETLPSADLKEADKIFKSFGEEAVKAYVAEKEKQTETSPTLTSGAGAPASERKLVSWSDVRKAADQRIQAGS